MNKNKFIVISVACIVVLLIIVAMYFFFKKSSDNNAGNVKENNKQIEIQSKNGMIMVDDFYKESQTDTYGQIYLQSTDYQSIRYEKASNLFIFSISAADSAEFIRRRLSLEQLFLQKLNITQEEACQLNVEIRTLRSYDLSISEKVFPLSFCKSGQFSQEQNQPINIR